ncbi:hypothetical protein DOK67_0002085 [Enterococcus sp. DIV0212c]|uniref:hypothetical protein n=1 Tax=Enterococcus sp. DIV0212c TaxID=2230867 RepID=UPI001A9AD3F2|nr:hypothetical protein [Enterococcus sp. DIV0212c]MBO1354737.1 hypothetical protein [Enterococcus sp. DIV0212c]
MWKRYITIYNGEAGSKSIFLDTLTKKLVVVEIGMTSYKSTLISGFLGVVIYSLFGNILFKASLAPITLVTLILIIGILGGIIFNILVNKIANSDKNKLEYLTNIDEEELTSYLVKGKKQSQNNFFLIIFLFAMLLICLLPIYFKTYSLLLLFASFFFTTLFTFFIGIVSPVKRIKAYRYIEKNKKSILYDNKGETNL